jgi:hypothetical protein
MTLRNLALTIIAAISLGVCGHANAGHIHGVAASSSPIAQISVDGGGWGGSTAQPANTGSPSDYGYNDPVIAQIDQPPYQTINAPLYFTVEAFHNRTAAQFASGLTSASSASCSADGGPWATTSQQSVNTQTGRTGFVFEITPATFTDKSVEVRCIAYSLTGKPLVIQGAVSDNSPSPSLFINTNAGGGLAVTTAWVSSTGSDSNSCTGSSQPAASGACATIYGALQKIAAVGSASGAFIKFVNGDAGQYSFGNTTEYTTYLFSGRWLTIDLTGSAAEIMSAPNSNGLRATNVHIKGGTIDFSQSGSLTLRESNSITPALWLDNVAEIGAGNTFVSAQPFSTPSAGWTGGVWTTESTFSNFYNGPTAANMNRNVTVHDITEDAFQNSLAVMGFLVYNECDRTYGASTLCGVDGVTGTLTPSSNCITNVSNPSAFIVGGQIIVGTATGPYWSSYPTVTSLTACGANAVQVSVTTLSSFGSSPTTGLVFDTGAHPDIYQINGALSGIIVEGGIAAPVGGQSNLAAQGIFSNASASPITNSAFVNNQLQNTGEILMQLGSKATNLLLLNDQLTGSTAWRTDQAFSASDVSVENGTCSTGHILNASGGFPTAGVTTLGGTC